MVGVGPVVSQPNIHPSRTTIQATSQSVHTDHSTQNQPSFNTPAKPVGTSGAIGTSGTSSTSGTTGTHGANGASGTSNPHTVNSSVQNDLPIIPNWPKQIDNVIPPTGHADLGPEDNLLLTNAQCGLTCDQVQSLNRNVDVLNLEYQGVLSKLNQLVGYNLNISYYSVMKCSKKFD